MSDYSRLYAATEERMSGLLADVASFITRSDYEEVASFVHAREYGLALETLACVLVADDKPVGISLLHAMDEAAVSMRLRDEPFMRDLHSFYDRQHRISAK
jgi:hypothetical protein